MSAILGLSGLYHDSAAVLLIDGEIIAAAHEERFTRIKHDAGFPIKAIQYVLLEGGKQPSELTCIAFYDKPLLKFERIMETVHEYAPKGLKNFIVSMPAWVKEKLFLKDVIRQRIQSIDGRKLTAPIVFPEHHLSHAASAFYPSPFKQSAILTIDGVGEWATATIGYGEDNNIKIIKEMKHPHSVGLLYSALTHFCGFKINSGEYKLMGLAPYGNADSDLFHYFLGVIKRELVKVFDDGSVMLNMKHFNFPVGLSMYKAKNWESLFGIPRRELNSEISQSYMDLALAIQKVIEEVVIKMAQNAKTLTGANNLVMAGGVALNCVANYRLLESGVFDKIWIQPAAGDAGGALGAGYAAFHIYEKRKRIVFGSDKMKGSYLGPQFADHEVMRSIRRYDAVFVHCTDDQMFPFVAQEISEGKIVGWFQGRMEWGPRALGNRSIIGDPRNPDMQKRLNLKIKHREGFRPFAPSVLEERQGDYFDLKDFLPYMTFVAKLLPEKRNVIIPDSYNELSLYDRLCMARSGVPAITHIDMTARIQSVSAKTNPRYARLIRQFMYITDCPMVVNTSFNIRGEPIVCTPNEAYRCFMITEMDILVINNYVFTKKEQPPFKEAPAV